MKLFIVALVALILAGCGTAQINPEQLAAVTTANNASVGCTTATGPWGRANILFVNAAQATQAPGKVTVNTDCSATIEANQPAAKP